MMVANHLRRQIDLGSMSIEDNAYQLPKPFIYQPLDTDADQDSIRLVLMEPDAQDSEPLSCQLIHVKFSEKPKYEALSYMWGTEDGQEEILLNGTKFSVGKNLRDALHFLRNSGNRTPFWIDAICINQHDIEERNKQLPMMRWIYFRAKTVVVWLGKKYTRFQLQNKSPTSQGTNLQENDRIGSQIFGDGFEKFSTTLEPVALLSRSDGSAKGTDEEQQMVAELLADGYWERLWIIQEIGRAAQKIVCFGNSAMGWNQFIKMVTLHNGSCEGPLKINRLLEEKYSGSHTLRKLLEDHKTALCKEPRDKVYGLVGLAANAIGFPMDYGKSLAEVWEDTMVFMNQRRLLPEEDIIPFGRLVKSLLIGEDVGPLDQVLQPYEPRPDSALPLQDSQSSRVFHLRAYVVGCILVVGPSTTDIISSLRKADEWAGEIQQMFPQELGDAHCENDNLMRAVLESDEKHVRSMCFSHVSNVRWEGEEQLIDRFYGPTIRGIKSKYSTSSQDRTQKSPENGHTTAGKSYLFLVRNCYQCKTAWKMGIASSLAQPGDVVCRVHGVERALILRVNFLGSKIYDRQSYQVFGTAIFTGDSSLSCKVSHPGQRGKPLTFSLGEQLVLQIDAATIYVLLA